VGGDLVMTGTTHIDRSVLLISDFLAAGEREKERREERERDRDREREISSRA